MFDLNRRPILWMIARRFRSNMYIPVYHTNRRPFKNMIGVVKNRLVGMGLKFDPIPKEGGCSGWGLHDMSQIQKNAHVA